MPISDKHIADSLVERGILTDEQVAQILLHSENTGLKFSEAGLALGILKQNSPVKVGRAAIDFFHVRPDYFPESTKSLIPKEAMLKHGALALGFKTAYQLFRPKRYLNVGFLDPSRTESVKAIEAIVKQRLDVRDYAGLRIYLVLADQFVDAIDHVYGIPLEGLRESNAVKLDPVLEKFLSLIISA